MERKLHFSNVSPAVKINGQWYGCIKRVIEGTDGLSAILNRNRDIFIPLSSEDEVENIIENSDGMPALEINDRIYIDNALTINEDGHIVSGGGYLETVQQYLAYGRCYQQSDDAWVIEPISKYVYFDALGIKPAEYSDGLRLSNLKVPTVYSDANIPRLNSYMREHMEKWKEALEREHLPTVIEETRKGQSSTDIQGYFTASSSNILYCGHFVSSGFFMPSNGDADEYEVSRCSYLGNYSGVSIDY